MRLAIVITTLFIVCNKGSQARNGGGDGWRGDDFHDVVRELKDQVGNCETTLPPGHQTQVTCEGYTERGTGAYQVATLIANGRNHPQPNYLYVCNKYEEGNEKCNRSWYDDNVPTYHWVRGALDPMNWPIGVQEYLLVVEALENEFGKSNCKKNPQYTIDIIKYSCERYKYQDDNYLWDEDDHPWVEDHPLIEDHPWVDDYPLDKYDYDDHDDDRRKKSRKSEKSRKRSWDSWNRNRNLNHHYNDYGEEKVWETVVFRTTGIYDPVPNNIEYCDYYDYCEYSLYEEGDEDDPYRWAMKAMN